MWQDVVLLGPTVILDAVISTRELATKRQNTRVAPAGPPPGIYSKVLWTVQLTHRPSGHQGLETF